MKVATANSATRTSAGAFTGSPAAGGYVVPAADLGHVRAVVDDFGEAILNPSTLDRLAHTIFACWITGALSGRRHQRVVAVARPPRRVRARLAARSASACATVACLLQMVAADSTARGVARHQPTKLAAIEGLATSRTAAPLGIVGWATLDA